MKIILHSLNQDESAVRRMAKAVEQHEKKQQLLREQKERKEMEDLEALKNKRRDKEKASRSFTRGQLTLHHHHCLKAQDDLLRLHNHL